MSGYLTTTETNAAITQSVDNKGASILSEVSGKYQTKAAMSGYVAQASLNTLIGQYIKGDGKAGIVSAVSGTYITKTDLSGYVQTSALTEIKQSIASTEAKISLTASYGSGTIGSNVRALLTLVTGADSSSIKLKADAVTIDGTLYLKATDYLKSGTTTIRGDKIETGELRLQNLRTTAGDYIVQYNTSTLNIGGMTGKVNVAEFQYVDIFAKYGLRFGFVGYDIMFERSSPGTILRPYQYSYQLKIGTAAYPVGEIRCDALYVNGQQITGGSGGSALKATDITKIYSELSSSYYLKLDSSKRLIPTTTGYEIGSTSYPFTTIYVGTSTYHWKISNRGIIPSSSTTLYFDIGSSTYPVNKIYAKEIYLNGTKLTAGSGGSSGGYAGSQLNMGGSTSYYIQATTSRELRPNTSASYYAFYLGTSTYYWHYAYIGSVAAYIGNTANSKIGFFGTAPVTRQTVSSSATVATLISALKKYGLIY